MTISWDLMDYVVDEVEYAADDVGMRITDLEQEWIRLRDRRGHILDLRLGPTGWACPQDSRAFENPEDAIRTIVTGDWRALQEVGVRLS
jgi:hypothetical protein